MRKNFSLLIPGLFLMTQAFADPKPKASLCHFDDEEGAWVAIQISENALQAHMKNHDDAAPGGATAQSGTQLDAACQLAATADPAS